MHIEAHTGLAWTLAVLVPGSDRRLRNCCVAAALIPDIDAAPYLISIEAYNEYHHTFGHNLWLGIVIALFSVWVLRARGPLGAALAGGLVAVCFGSHMLTDAYFTRYPVYLLWPFSKWGLTFKGGVWLGAPINHYMVYGSMVMAIVLAFWKKVTPLDVFWPRLDRIVVNAFSKKDLTCATCEKACNNRCSTCEAPTCGKHAQIRWSFYIACPKCAGEGAPAPEPEPEEA